jgi:hypothetical protein
MGGAAPARLDHCWCYGWWSSFIEINERLIKSYLEYDLMD